ncbi:MAG: hypothetical protein ACYC2H_09970 [Thermoplasmatota archaeon]
MSMKSRLLEKMLADLSDELPARDAAVQARLANPLLRKSPETTQLLAVFDLLLAAPVAAGQFNGLLRRMLEDAALLCEFGGGEGEAQRVWAREFLGRLRDIVTTRIETNG